MNFFVQAADIKPFRRLLDMLGPDTRKRLLQRVGFAVSRQAKENARAMHGKARQQSTRGGGFWAAIANSISYNATTEQVEIGAAHEASAHKEFGGTITAPGRGPGATGAKALTIPLSFMPVKYRGRSVGELKAQLDIFRRGDILFGREKDTAGAPAMPLFVLRKSVTQKAQPWWPTDQQTNACLSDAIDSMKFGG